MKILLPVQKEIISLPIGDIEFVYEHRIEKVCAVKYLKGKYEITLIDCIQCVNTIIENYNQEKISKMKEILS